MNMSDRVLELRRLEMSIEQIAAQLGISITEVCNVLYVQNNKDKMKALLAIMLTRRII